MEYGEQLVNASTAVKIIAVGVVLIVVVAGTFAGLTFPRAVVDFSVSFTDGIDIEQKAFEVPFLHNKVQVEVIVTNGSSLWRAVIKNDAVAQFWQYTETQGANQTYHSEWIPLQSGRYNFTFANLNSTSALDASIKVISKGGFW
jgi:hypothetical protein